GFRFFAGAVLDQAGERPIALILLLLIAQGALVATWSFVTAVGLSLVKRRLYLRRSEEPGLHRPDGGETSARTEKPLAPWSWRLTVISLPIFLVAPLFLWMDLSRYAAAHSLVQVTAHRGHARAAPENTLSAIRKAIASGADYAEIDVQ